MTPEQRANCEALLRFLEEDAIDSQCQMAIWVGRRDDLPIPPKEERGKPECGTAACLAGWAALLLAPTEDLVKYRQAFSYQHRDQLLVPRKWVEQYEGLSFRSPFPESDKVAVEVYDIGTTLLGDQFIDWFGDSGGPDACRMSDRQWMIAVLRQELGMDFDPRLKSEEERNEDRYVEIDEPYEDFD